MSAEGGWLAASDEAWLYERYEVRVVGLPQNVTNVSIRVEGGMGLVEYRSFGSDRWANATFEVTEAWGSAGTVVLSWTNGTGNDTEAWEEQQSFRVACSSSCIVALVGRAIDKSVQGYVALAAGVVFLALFAIGHGAAVYARRNGQPPWTETVALAVRSKVSRDPLYRSKTDPLGILPAGMRAEWADMAAAVRAMSDIQIGAKRVWSRTRGFARRVHRLEKRAKKLGLLKQTPPANPVSSMKPPEERVRLEVPEQAKRAAKPHPPPKSKPAPTAASVMEAAEKGGYIPLHPKKRGVSKGRRS